MLYTCVTYMFLKVFFNFSYIYTNLHEFASRICEFDNLTSNFYKLFDFLWKSQKRSFIQDIQGKILHFKTSNTLLKHHPCNERDQMPYEAHLYVVLLHNNSMVNNLHVITNNNETIVWDTKNLIIYYKITFI